MRLLQEADRDRRQLCVWLYAVCDAPSPGEVFAGRWPEKWLRWGKLKDEYGSSCRRILSDRQSVLRTRVESDDRHHQPEKLGVGSF